MPTPNFGHSVGPEASIEHVQRLRRRTEAEMEGYRAHERELAERAQAEADSPAPCWLVVLRGGIRYSEMLLEWCDETESTLRSLQVQSAEDRSDRASLDDQENPE